MATTLTRNLGLIIDDTLTPNAKRNLRKIDDIGAIYRVLPDGTVQFRSQTDIVFQPEDDTIGGSGSGGSIQFGSEGNQLDSFTVYTTDFNISTFNLADLGSEFVLNFV